MRQSPLYRFSARVGSTVRAILAMQNTMHAGNLYAQLFPAYFRLACLAALLENSFGNHLCSSSFGGAAMAVTDRTKGSSIERFSLRA
jgi:hypothetical protein